jgi:phytoene synthase
MTAVEYRQTPNRVQLRPIPAALRLGNEAGTVARRRDLSGDPVFWAIRFLSRPRRSAMYALYWFWREIETIARDETSDLLKEALLSDWRSEIALLYDGRPRREVTRSLVGPVRLYGLKCDDFLTIVNGLGTGTRGAAQAPSLAAFDFHGALVAVAMGRLAVRIFGLEELAAERIATEFGRGAHITRILRDLSLDAPRNRLYLPRELLRAHGIVSTHPGAVLTHPLLGHVCHELAVTAEKHYAAAAAAIGPGRSREARVAALMLGGCREILHDSVARGWEHLEKPVGLSAGRKAELLLRYGLASAESLLWHRVSALGELVTREHPLAP